MDDIRIIIDFPSEEGGKAARREFVAPIAVVTAFAVDELVDALARVEEAAASGKWCAGFVTYEAAPAFDAAMRVRVGGRMPLLWFGVFDAPVAASSVERPLVDDVSWHATQSDDALSSAILTAQAAILAGETYQVNYTTRLHSRTPVDASSDYTRAWYEQLRAAQGDGWHAFIRTPDHDVLSVSPELFFMRRGTRLETRPMKGTAPRGRYYEEDRSRAAALHGSAKDRAENLMIVDLLRNDIGRIAETGTVRVPSLYDVEKYETVWQLTSRIEGTLRSDVGLVDIFRALFPCGSVTGAPKINTMKWIAELETSPREVYCGAIGVIAPGGDCTFSVPIRTVVVERRSGEAVYGVGAGITIDSTVDGELAEFRAKADVLHRRRHVFELLETMRVMNGVVLRRGMHMARLARSAAYFGFAFDRAAVEGVLDAELSALSMAGERSEPAEPASARAGRYPRDVRLRMRVSADGAVAFDHGDAPPWYPDRDACRAVGGIERVRLAKAPVDSRDPFLCNKTTYRTVYEVQRAAWPDAFDVLLFNQDGQVTEFTNGNIVALIGGMPVTPPRETGLLNGTFRQELLDAGIVGERGLQIADLALCERLWLVNSVRGWVEVALLH
ncbi:MAG TPA: chorismate-binding protein [Longimicrobiales bacterium]